MKLALAIASIWLFAAKSTALIAFWSATGRRP